METLSNPPPSAPQNPPQSSPQNPNGKSKSKMELEESAANMMGGYSHSQYQTTPADKRPQYIYTIAVTMSIFAAGTIIGWSSPALPQLEISTVTTNLINNTIQVRNATSNVTTPTSEGLKITKEEGSWVGSLLAIGAFIGALPAGSVADLIGRKKTILAMSVPLIFSWVLIYFAGSAMVLYAARLIAGIGLGALCTTVPMYISEIAEDSIRGTLCSSFQLMMVIGILYTYILGAVVHYTSLPLLCGLVNLVFLAAFFKAPEAPIYLLKKDKRQQAEASLLTLRGRKYNVYRELHTMEKSLSTGGNAQVSFFQAMTKKANIKAMIICLGLMFFQQLSGINIVVFYSGDIFKSAGSSLEPEIATIFVGLAQVVATFVSAILIEKAGRKCLLQFSALIMAICLGVLGYYFYLKENNRDVSSLGTVPLAAVVTYILVFGVGFGPIPWMMSGELLSSDIKGVGTGIAVATNWFLAFTVTKIFQTLISALKGSGTYWLLAAICSLGVIFCTFVVIETKGKSMAEVQEELSGKKYNRTDKSNVVV